MTDRIALDGLIDIDTMRRLVAGEPVELTYAQEQSLRTGIDLLRDCTDNTEDTAE